SWSRLWYRTESPSTRVGRLQQVEHEAFATLLAERAGVPVMPVVVAGLAWERDAVLVTAAHATPAARLASEAASDELLMGWWLAVDSLHQAGVAHGDVNTYALVVRDDGVPALTGLAAASTNPSPAQLATDLAQLLVATALVVGPEPAVAAASAAA